MNRCQYVIKEMRQIGIGLLMSICCGTLRKNTVNRSEGTISD